MGSFTSSFTGSLIGSLTGSLTGSLAAASAFSFSFSLSLAAYSSSNFLFSLSIKSSSSSVNLIFKSGANVVPNNSSKSKIKAKKNISTKSASMLYKRGGIKLISFGTLLFDNLESG